MKTIHFATLVHATRQAVWAAMLGPETYKTWTAEYCEGSYIDETRPQGRR